MDGWYVTRSQGGRCDECPWMDGQIFAPCNICTSTVRGGRISQRAMDGGEMNIHGWTVYLKEPWKAVRLLQLTPSNVMLKLMKNTLLISLLITLIFSFTVRAGLYKGLDDEGNVVYSDQPFEDAEKFTPPSLTVFDAPKTETKKKATEEEKTAEFKYTDFDIVSPTNNQTLRDETNPTISLHLKPALNTTEGHNIWLLMNGQPVVKNSQNTSLQISRVDRGAHQLQAQVKDKQGKIIARTRAIVIHVKNTAVPRKSPR